MKKISVFAISAFIGLSCFAGTMDSTVETRAHEFGVHGGTTTGIGLSYRYWPKKYGVQFTALPIKTDNKIYLNLAITGLRTFYNSKNIRFFGYLSNNLTLNRTKSNSSYYSSYTDEKGNFYTYCVNEPDHIEKKIEYNLGFGPGFGFGDRVRFNIMMGYAIYDVFKAFNIRPTGELGIYFRM